MADAARDLLKHFGTAPGVIRERVLQKQVLLEQTSRRLPELRYEATPFRHRLGQGRSTSNTR